MHKIIFPMTCLTNKLPKYKYKIERKLWEEINMSSGWSFLLMQQADLVTIGKPCLTNSDGSNYFSVVVSLSVVILFTSNKDFIKKN
jgi:hypothetical protein